LKKIKNNNQQCLHQKSQQQHILQKKKKKKKTAKIQNRIVFTSKITTATHLATTLNKILAAKR
jgi:hypothetical protein